jgi:RND family efflux transporter MFP subunit
MFMPHWSSSYTRALVAAACLTTAACADKQTAQARAGDEDGRPVKVEAVREETIRRTVEVVATLAAEAEVTVSSETDGRVSRLLADLGDHVAADQVLVELDREKQEYNVEGERAALASALARYGAEDSGHLPPVDRTPDVQKAQAELVQARQSYERAEELHKRQLVPKQTLDDAESALRSKQAVYASSLQNAKNLRADIDATTAAMRLSERELRDTSIRAPFAGSVQRRMVSLGEFVKNQTPVMSVVKMDPLKVTAEIPEKMAPWIAVGQPVAISVDAFPDRAITGKVSRISPSVNPATRAFPFEALVPNADASLKPGTFARVHVETNRVDTVITVPYSAIQYRYGVNRVFVLQGDHLSVRELKVGERIGDRIEVVDGLKSGEPVAIADVDQLADGLKVKVG